MPILNCDALLVIDNETATVIQAERIGTFTRVPPDLKHFFTSVTFTVRQFQANFLIFLDLHRKKRTRTSDELQDVQTLYLEVLSRLYAVSLRNPYRG